MSGPNNTLHDNEQDTPLIPLADFCRSGRAPVEMHHLIFQHRDSLESFGVIVRYGRKWLVSEPHLYRWLRRFGKEAGSVTGSSSMS